MGGFRRGMRLAGQSFRVLGQAPELMLLPMIGFVLFVGSFLGLFRLAFGRMPVVQDFDGESILALFPVVSVSGTFLSFANAAVVGASCRLLEGEDATAGDGLRMAWRRLPRLLLWNLLNGVGALCLIPMAERLKPAGRIKQASLGLGWSWATMLVVPILLLEDVGPVDSVRRSATLVRRRWGEGLSDLRAIGLVMLVVSLPLWVAAGIATIAAPHLLVVSWTLVVGVLVTGIGAVEGVHTAALYRYAVAGDVAGPSTAEEPQGSFVKAGTFLGAVPHRSQQLQGWWRWGMAAACAASGPLVVLVSMDVGAGGVDPPGWTFILLGLFFITGWAVGTVLFLFGRPCAALCAIGGGAFLAASAIGLLWVGNDSTAVVVATIGVVLAALGTTVRRHARTRW